MGPGTPQPRRPRTTGNRSLVVDYTSSGCACSCRDCTAMRPIWVASFKTLPVRNRDGSVPRTSANASGYSVANATNPVPAAKNPAAFFPLRNSTALVPAALPKTILFQCFMPKLLSLREQSFSPFQYNPCAMLYTLPSSVDSIRLFPGTANMTHTI